MIKTIIGWLVGPFTGIVKSWVQAKANVQLTQIERQAQKDVLTADIRKTIIADAQIRDRVVTNIIADDRRDTRTAWIRPVTVGLSILFWIIIAGTQMQHMDGTPVIPFILTIPDGGYGELLFALPLGIIGTFVIGRPFEKIAMIWKGK